MSRCGVCRQSIQWDPARETWIHLRTGDVEAADGHMALLGGRPRYQVLTWFAAIIMLIVVAVGLAAIIGDLLPGGT